MKTDNTEKEPAPVAQTKDSNISIQVPMILTQYQSNDRGDWKSTSVYNHLKAALASSVEIESCDRPEIR